MRLRVGRKSSCALGHDVRTLRVVIVGEALVEFDAVVARGGDKLAPCGGVPERRVVLVATLRVGGGLRQRNRALDDEPRVVHGRAGHNLDAVGEDGPSWRGRGPCR